MFAVIFEVQPRQERWDDYLDLAKRLKPELDKIDGFIDNERFASTRTKGRLLSLSIWRDEKAVIRWRTHGIHHGAQEKGRFEIFEDYHLRVGEITGDTHIAEGQSLAQYRFDETAIGEAKIVTISQVPPVDRDGKANADLAAALQLPQIGTEGVIDQEGFESIHNAGKRLLLVSWRDAASAVRWNPQEIGGGALRQIRVRVIRDYGMTDRREAPQYYADPGSARP